MSPNLIITMNLNQNEVFGTPQPISCQCSLSIPPENIRKPEAF